MRSGAVLIDLDNTLYAYDPCNEVALKAVHQALFEAKVKMEYPAFRECHDQVRTELSRRLVGQAACHDRVIFFKEMLQRLTGGSYPSLVLLMTETYWATFLDAMVLPPDTAEALTALRSRHKLAMISNQTTEIQLRKLVRLGIADVFDVVVTSEEVGCEKPDKRIFVRALEALEVPARRAVMIGDDQRRDIDGARNAGVRGLKCTEHAATAAAAGNAQDGDEVTMMAIPTPSIEAFSKAPMLVSKMIPDH